MTEKIRIKIRPLEVSDADMMHQGLQDQRIYTYIDEQPPADLDALRARYELICQGAPRGLAEMWLNWIILEYATNEPVGILQAIIDVNSGRASIAYVVFPPMWGRCVGSEATEWLLGHLHDEFGVAEAQAEIHERNVKSLNLARSLKFVDVGSQ